MRSLQQRIVDQAEHCRAAGSALTGALLEGAAADLAAGGVVADLLGRHRDEPAGSVPALRLAGALHRLVLERRAPELALHYPSVGGTASVEDVWPAAERTCREHLAVMRELVARPVQTNEVGRSAVLYGALCLLGAPRVRLLELGSSAGLNLRCERFGFEVADGVVLGDPTSPVRLRRPWTGALPAYDARRPAFEVVSRRGCDPAPLDPTSTEGRVVLTSYVWADQAARLERLRAALRVAAEVPAVVERAGALDFLGRHLREVEDGVTTVVWHSVVWQYVDPAERAAVDRLIAEAGAAATERAPLVRVSMEPEPARGGSVDFRVHLQRWPGGERVHVADAEGHGPPVRWTGARMSR